MIFRSGDFSTKSIISALFSAILLSAFIYLEHFGLAYKPLVSLLAVVAIYRWVATARGEAFWLGFFTSLLWFWWTTLSFRFTDYIYLAPLSLLFITSVFGLIFHLIAIFPIYIRAFLIAFGFILIEPFGFAWFKPEIILGGGYFSYHFLAFPLVVFAGFLFAFLPRFKFTAILPLVVALFLPTPDTPQAPDQRIFLAQTSLDQSIKWDKSYRSKHIADALDIIDQAIADQYEIVVLPEASFAFFLNHDQKTMEELIAKSYDISIVAGALYLENRTTPYNSTYIFDGGEVQVANKVFLVPFGEGSIFPDWITKIFNSIFFDGAVDYQTATKPTDYQLRGTTFRNAICYEASLEAMYKNAPDFMIAISNNGWFTPSIEPTLQHLLIRHFSKRHGVLVLHSINS